MGDMADYYRSQELSDHLDISFNNSSRQESYEVWTTKKDDRIYLKDMSTNHIRNVMKSILDDKITFKSTIIEFRWLCAFATEIKSRL